MFMKIIPRKIEKIVHIIELIIASMIIIGILIGLIDLARYFILIFTARAHESYNLFQSFLGLALLLIVGAELIHMILYHSTESLLELILFVIARKMLIYSTNVIDLVFVTIAIAIVFFTMRFLVDTNGDKIMKKENAMGVVSMVKEKINPEKKEESKSEDN